MSQCKAEDHRLESPGDSGQSHSRAWLGREGAGQAGGRACKRAGRGLFSLATAALPEGGRFFVCLFVCFHRILVTLLLVLRHWILDKPGQIKKLTLAFLKRDYETGQEPWITFLHAWRLFAIIRFE